MDFDSASGDSGDDDEYRDAADAFLDGFDEWAVERFGEDDGDRRADAGLFLDWNHNFRGKGLDNLTRNDVDEFLLGWLPGNYMGSSDEAPAIVHAVQSVIEFLAANDGLEGGAERAASLIAHTYDIADDVAKAMDDPSKLGLAKAVLGASLVDDGSAAVPGLSDLLADSDLTIEELQPLLEAQMNAFNDLPFEERKRLTDPALDAKRQMPLGFTFVPPQPDDVEASAAGSDVVRMVDGFVRRAVDQGIALTNRGNIKMADARELVAELATGDGDAKVRSSVDLRWLTLVDDLATASGAVERGTTTIRSYAEWFDLTATDKATQLAELVLHGGFLSSYAVSPQWLNEQRELLDDGVPHWFSIGLVEGTVLPVHDIVTHALEVTALRQGDRRDELGADRFDETVVAALGELFEGLARFGLVTWHERQRVERAARGSVYSTGGELELTPLGRHVLPGIVRQAGYTFDEVVGVEDASAQQMVDIAMAYGLSGAEVLERWRTDLDLPSRLELIAACVITGEAPERLVGFDLFSAVNDPVAVAPIVRQLLDSPAGAYAATYLLDHGQATHDDVGAFIDLTPVVDMLFATIGEPEVFDEVFQSANRQIDGDFIEELWRHDLPEVAWVLEAAGQHVNDKALAKAARAAAIKHRSWLANQGR